MTPPRDRPTITARSGVRRTPTQIQEILRGNLRRTDAVRILSDDAEVTRLARTAELITWDGGTSARVQQFNPRVRVDVAGLRAVRRMGSHNGAASKIVIHATMVGEQRAQVLAESKLEGMWLTWIDRQPGVWGYQGQAAIIRWRYGDRCIFHIPDVVGSDADGRRWIVNVKPENRMTEYNRLVLTSLLPATCAYAKFGCDLFGSMPRQMQQNLSALSVWRWDTPVVEAGWWPAVFAARPSTVGGIADVAGGGPAGLNRALRVIAQCHADIDLDEQIQLSSPVVWRTQP